MRTQAILLALVLSGALCVGHSKSNEPSASRLLQASATLYPAILAREELEAPFVVGIVFDADHRVVRHSGSIPPRKGITTALLTEMFPRQHPEECESVGLSVIRQARGVGGQFDKGVFAVWCVLQPK
jgi:hypothetical protein